MSHEEPGARVFLQPSSLPTPSRPRCAQPEFTPQTPRGSRPHCPYAFLPRSPRLSFSNPGIWTGWSLSTRTTRSARPLLASPPPACTRRPRTAREPFLTLACSCSCLGVLSTQAYTYFKRYPLDKPFYKALVRDAKPAPIPRERSLTTLAPRLAGRRALVRFASGCGLLWALTSGKG